MMPSEDFLRQFAHQFDLAFQARGDAYRVSLLGRCRPDGVWEGRIQFEPGGGGGVVMTTPVESTQPNEGSLLQWASGLGVAFFEGAFDRALASVDQKKQRRPVKAVTADSANVDAGAVERKVLECFARSRARTLNREAFFDLIDDFSNADVQRAIESLEREGRIARFTDRGSAWVTLKETAPQRRTRSRTQPA
jgi:hypothetical protein